MLSQFSRTNCTLIYTTFHSSLLGRLKIKVAEHWGNYHEISNYNWQCRYYTFPFSHKESLSNTHFLLSADWGGRVGVEVGVALWGRAGAGLELLLLLPPSPLKALILRQNVMSCGRIIWRKILRAGKYGQNITNLSAMESEPAVDRRDIVLICYIWNK